MREKKKCELCSNISTIYCESDKARLCFECDSKVHAANFLVAKHTRTLLCNFCQSLTLWSGSGPRLGPMMSVCQMCNSSYNNSAHNVEMLRGDVHGEDDRSFGNGDDGYTDDDDNDGDEGDERDEEDDDHGLEYDEDEDEDDEDNQVVPWSYSPSHQR